MAQALNVNKNLVNSEFQTNQNHVQPMDTDTAKKVFALYQRFFGNKDPDYAWMKNDFNAVETCSFPWQDLDIRISPTEMEPILKETGILQLRPIPEDSRTLVVGCGNEPIANSASFPLEPKNVGDPQSIAYQKVHNHFHAITINPHLAHNPTLVGFFGAQRFPMLKTGQFDVIVIEGTKISDTRIGRDELNRLLRPAGRVVVNQGDEKGLKFSWENNSKNFWANDYVPPPVVIEDLNIYESFNYPTNQSQ